MADHFWNDPTLFWGKPGLTWNGPAATTQTQTMKNIIVLNLEGKTDLEVAQTLRDTAQKITDNATDFPDAEPTPAELIAGAVAIETGVTLANTKRQQAESATGAKDATVAAGRGLLDDAAAWAAKNVKDPVKLKKVFDLKKAPVATTSMPTVDGLKASFGDQPGWVDTMWNPPTPKARSFEVQVKLPGADFAHAKTVSASRATLKGLPSAQYVDIRVRAIGPKGIEGGWSDPWRQLVP